MLNDRTGLAWPNEPSSPWLGASKRGADSLLRPARKTIRKQLARLLKRPGDGLAFA